MWAFNTVSDLQHISEAIFFLQSYSFGNTSGFGLCQKNSERSNSGEIIKFLKKIDLEDREMMLHHWYFHSGQTFPLEAQDSCGIFFVDVGIGEYALMLFNFACHYEELVFLWYKFTLFPSFFWQVRLLFASKLDVFILWIWTSCWIPLSVTT